MMSNFLDFIPAEVTLAGTQTLTNKTLNIANNTLTGVQPTLVSGTNIKTVGGQSVLGSGDLEVGGGGTAEFIATGSISAGQTVALKSDGTVEVIFEIDQAAAVGNQATPANIHPEEITALYDSFNQKVVVVFKNNATSFLVCFVGSVSGTTLTFGSVVNITGFAVQYATATFDSINNKIVVGYVKSSDTDGYSVVGTVAGNSISFGAETKFKDGTVTFLKSTFDSTNGKVVFVWREELSLNRGQAVVGTVSGTNITFGSLANFETAEITRVNATYDPVNQKVVICYNSFNALFGIIGTISGTSISFGTRVNIESNAVSFINMCYINDEQKIAVAYNSSNDFILNLLTVSGTTISVGARQTITIATTTFNNIFYDSFAKKLVISFLATSQYLFVLGAISGNTVIFTSSTTIDAGNGEITSVYADNANTWVAFFRSTAAVIKANPYKNLTYITNANNFIGLSTETVSSGNPVLITTSGGINESVSGLSATTKYWLSANGSLSSSSTAYPLVGVATSATKILAGNDTIATGAWVLLDSVSASASSTVDFTNIDASFDNYVVVAKNLTASALSLFGVQLFINGAIVISGYGSSSIAARSDSATLINFRSGSAQIHIFSDWNEAGHFQLNLFGSKVTTNKTASAFGNCSRGGVFFTNYSGGVLVNAGTVTGLRFIANTGTTPILTGDFYLYGIRN